MEAAEETRRALISEIEILRPHVVELLDFFFTRFRQPEAAVELTDKVVAPVRALEPFAASTAQECQTFQARVRPWLLECFGEAIADDGMERNHRFLEEALELVQACGCTADEAQNLVDYVFGRPVGERSQEVGGVMVTLAALCLAHKLDMHGAGEVELERISQPAMILRIREKQASKPAMSPLPGAYPDRRQAQYADRPCRPSTKSGVRRLNETHPEETTLHPLEVPVSLKGIKLVRAFAARLTVLPVDCQLPQKSFDIWSMPLAETGATEGQMDQVGAWYAQHHSTSPSLPYIVRAARTLIANGSLPAHRMANRLEREAMVILKATEALGISADDCAQTLMLAGTLAHLALYRRTMPDISREYLRSEVEGIARMCDYTADEILNEIQGGHGDLKALGEYLFELPPDDGHGE